MNDYLLQASFLHRQEADRLKAQQELEAQQEVERLRHNRMVDFCHGAAEGERLVRFAPDGTPACSPGTCVGLLANRGSALAVICCHPWGPLGGSMRDPHVALIAATLGVEGGLTTLRFNFRYGIGAGRASASDLRGACAFLLGLDGEGGAAAPCRLLLIGYSYGACVVADVAPTLPQCSAFAMLAPPLGAAPLLFCCRDVMAGTRDCIKPKLMLVGDGDQFCSTRRFASVARALAAPKQCVVLADGTDEGCCHADGCHKHTHSHKHKVDHFSLYPRLAAALLPWLQATFGVASLAALAQSSGAPVAAGLSSTAAGADDGGDSDTELLKR